VQHDGARVGALLRIDFPASPRAFPAAVLPARAFSQVSRRRRSDRARFVPRGLRMDAMPHGLGNENRPARFFGGILGRNLVQRGEDLTIQ